jgi:hypothetical protein
MGGAEPTAVLAVQQPNVVSEARRLTAGGASVVKEVRGNGRRRVALDLRMAHAMVVGLLCLSLRRRQRMRAVGLFIMFKMFRMSGGLAILNNMNILNTIEGARTRSIAVDLCKSLQPAVHDEASHRRGETCQSPRGLPLPAVPDRRIHPASASRRSAWDRRSLSRNHDQPGR